MGVSGVEVYDLTYCKNANAAEYGSGLWKGAECEKLVRFSPDLPDDELAVGDYIRVGNEIRQIGSLIRSTDSGNYSSAYVTSQFNRAYGAGTYAYRHNAAKAIEYGLEHLSNDVIGEVTATKSKSSGRVLLNSVTTSALYANSVVGSPTTNHGGATITFKTSQGFAAGAAGVGDVFRVHSLTGMSQIEGLDSTTAAAAVVKGVTLQDDWLTTSDDVGTIGTDNTLAEIPIIDNGFKYKIAFEDNSGDLPDLVCNTDGLRSVYRMDEAAYVSRDEPDRVYFVDTKQGSAQPAYSTVKQTDLRHPSAITAGDTIYVGEQ